MPYSLVWICQVKTIFQLPYEFLFNLYPVELELADPFHCSTINEVLEHECSAASSTIILTTLRGQGCFLAPECQCVDLISLFRLIVVDDLAYHRHVVRILYDGCWSHVWLCSHRWETSARIPGVLYCWGSGGKMWCCPFSPPSVGLTGSPVAHAWV